MTFDINRDEDEIYITLLPTLIPFLDIARSIANECSLDEIVSLIHKVVELRGDGFLPLLAERLGMVPETPLIVANMDLHIADIHERLDELDQMLRAMASVVSDSGNVEAPE